MIQLPEFASKAERQEWFIKNNRLVVNAKKSTIKRADGFTYSGLHLLDKDNKVEKADANTIPPETTRIKVRSIINTTRLFDSHYDVHIDQLWNKSLKENTENYLCNQHAFSFEGVVTDNVKAFVKRYTWKELGFPYSGDTQALVYDSVIDKTEGGSAEFIFNQYVRGKVKQHSVGMRYVNLFLCVNNSSYKEYFENWEKYFEEYVANKEECEEAGIFYAVTQAKNIEGSPVLKGSNFATPTQSVEAAKNTSNEDKEEEAATDTSQTVNKFFNPNLY